MRQSSLFDVIKSCDFLVVFAVLLLALGFLSESNSRAEDTVLRLPIKKRTAIILGTGPDYMSGFSPEFYDEMEKGREKAKLGSVFEPVWKTLNLGVMSFGSSLFRTPNGESKASPNKTSNDKNAKIIDSQSEQDLADLERFGISPNQTGAVSGKDFLEVLMALTKQRIPSRSELEKIVRDEQAKKQDLKLGQADAELQSKLKEYDTFMVGLRTKIQALLMLTRIIDRESLKLAIDYTVSKARVEYILRSILLISATDQNRAKKPGRVLLKLTEKNEVSEVCDVAKISYIAGDQKVDFSAAEIPQVDLIEQLFLDFRLRVGKQPVSITFDWDYIEGGLDRSLEHLKEEAFGDQWPSVDLKLSPVPENIDEFRAMIAKQLHPIYRSFVRDFVLRQVFGKLKNIDLGFLDLKMNSVEIAKIAEQARIELNKASEETLEGAFQEVVMSGAARFEFGKKFREEMQKITDQILVDSDSLTMAKIAEQMKGAADSKGSGKLNNKSKPDATTLTTQSKAQAQEKGDENETDYTKKSSEIEARKEKIVSQAFNATREIFSHEIDAKRLKVALRERLVRETVSPLTGTIILGSESDSIVRSQNQLLSSDARMQKLIQMDLKASQRAKKRRLISCFGATENDEIRFLFYGRELKSVTKTPLNATALQETLDRFATSKVKEKWFTHFQRGAVNSLFASNAFSSYIDLSVDAAWSDFSIDPDDLAASLFIETPYNSTDVALIQAKARDQVNDDRRVDRLQNISAPLLGLMKKIPNDKH